MYELIKCENHNEYIIKKSFIDKLINSVQKTIIYFPYFDNEYLYSIVIKLYGKGNVLLYETKQILNNDNIDIEYNQFIDCRYIDDIFLLNIDLMNRNNYVENLVNFINNMIIELEINDNDKINENTIEFLDL